MNRPKREEYEIVDKQFYDIHFKYNDYIKALEEYVSNVEWDRDIYLYNLKEIEKQNAMLRKIIDEYKEIENKSLKERDERIFELVKENKKLNKALDRACFKIVEYIPECPTDKYCNCDDNCIKCWEEWSMRGVCEVLKKNG